METRDFLQNNMGLRFCLFVLWGFLPKEQRVVVSVGDVLNSMSINIQTKI